MKTTLCAALTAPLLLIASTATAQNAILAEMYGKGVHAYYSGDYTSARQYLSMAIDNGTDDPRAFYFRGLVAHSQGSTLEAESDWQRGAELEAKGSVNPHVGRALTRFQGSGRLKLEQIRHQARLQAAAVRAARSNQRIGEIDRSAAVRPAPTPPAASSSAPSSPPPAAAAGDAAPAADDPFAGDLAEGEANVMADDALEGATEDPFGDTAVPAAGAGDAAPAAGSANPFGDSAPASEDSDPFGGSGDAGEDPFGA